MFSTAYAVFFLGYGVPYVRAQNSIGDYSYGIYIYGWFMQQVAASLSIDQPPLVNFCIAAVLSILAGALSWHYIEAPALRISKKISIPSLADFVQLKMRKVFARGATE